MCVWTLVLLFLGVLIYLNQIGLPDFAKRPLLQMLRDRGLDLQFSRVRLNWYRGLVADNVRFGRADDPTSPSLTVKQVALLLDYGALARGRFQVDTLVLRQGQLAWPVPSTNSASRELSVKNIQTELHLLPNDVWQLDNFQAQFAGARLRLAGTITNASALQNWKSSVAAPPAIERGKQLQWLADTVEQIYFSSAPEANVTVSGDARDLQSFSLRAGLRAPDADTPWGTIGDGLLSVVLFPGTSNGLSRAEINVSALEAQTPWVTSSNFQLSLHLLSPSNLTGRIEAGMNATADSLETQWGTAANASLAAQWSHALTNPVPVSGQGELRIQEAQTRWGNAKEVAFTGNLAANTNLTAPLDPAMAWWTNLAPWLLNWECRVAALESPHLKAADISADGDWQAPNLEVSDLKARVYDGPLATKVSLNAASRQIHFSGSSDFDAKKISALLPRQMQEWLSQYSWQKAPQVQFEGLLKLPARVWTNCQVDWQYDIRPTIRLQGNFHVEDGAFRGVPASTASAHFSYSNECWFLPDLVVTRPEGRLNLVHQSSDVTRNFYFGFHSTIDVRDFRRLLPPAAQRDFDLLGLSQPPVLNGEVWGRWKEPERTVVSARVAVTNFTLRGEWATGFQTAVNYSNRILTLVEPRLQRGTQQVAAASVIVDFTPGKIYLTNGFSTAEPMVVARAIGPQVARAVEDYHFLEPPTARVEGTIPIRHEEDADLHFDIAGGPFAWWKFKVPRIAGKVDWVGQQVELKNVVADFYGGAATGSATFDFQMDEGAVFHFNVLATNADLHFLTEDLSGKTNKLEGRLAAQVNISHASTEDWRECEGRGHATLRDALIWDTPIFGILTPVLDAVLPGQGSSRVKEGSAFFTITNGIAHTDDLEVQTLIARLRFWGGIDLQGNVDGRMDAEPLHDAWVVGPVLSLALWPVSKFFESRVTGTISAPKSEPVFIPKLFPAPSHPLRSTKDLAPADSFSTNGIPAVTNTVPPASL